MVKVIISGCNGKMGRVVSEICAAHPQIRVVAGFDVMAQKTSDFPVYTDPMEFAGIADCVIDFSNPAALDGLLSYCVKKSVPLVLATTGHSEEQLVQLSRAAEKIPVFKSANMSLGINVLLELVRKAAGVLGGVYDIEIVERHHNRKVDAPSGTALMIADAAASALEFTPEYVYGRHDVRQPRGPNEIGISAIRGGTIVGEHEVIFAGRDEIIEIRHSAMSREIFATGAVRAAIFMAGREKPGMYDMASLVSEEGSNE